METGKRKGWHWPINQRKAHFFDEQNERPRESLCGRVGMLFASIEYLFNRVDNTRHKAKFNCKGCEKKRAKLYPDGQ